MTTLEIEALLRKAPQPEPPDDLLERLLEDVPPGPIKRPVRLAPPFWSFPRWLSAAAVLVCLLAGLGVWALQNGRVAQLRRENAALRAQQSERLRQELVNQSRTRNAADELQQLQRSYAEMQRLQTQLDGIPGQTEELVRLRQENLRLRQAAGLPFGVPPQFDAELTELRKSLTCYDNLKSIGLAVHLYATDHEDTFPTDFLIVTNGLTQPSVLHCPSDTNRNVVADWPQLSLASVSYQSFLFPGAQADSTTIIAKCPIHHHVCLADGSVWKNPEANGMQILSRNGHEYLVPAPTLHQEQETQ